MSTQEALLSLQNHLKEHGPLIDEYLGVAKKQFELTRSLVRAALEESTGNEVGARRVVRIEAGKMSPAELVAKIGAVSRTPNLMNVEFDQETLTIYAIFTLP